jgi:hypothetical protein
MVMARELYALFTPNALCLPSNPSNATVYVCPTVASQPVDNTPLTPMEQAMINMRFVSENHYFLSMRNIEQACFTSLDASANDTFKVSNDPTMLGCHSGMRVIDILDQLSTIYGQPTTAVLEANNTVFRSPYPDADVHEVLFRCIKECAKTALLGCNPYTDWQLVMNAIHLLLRTRLYTRPFEDWDQLALRAQIWIALQTMI